MTKNLERRRRQSLRTDIAASSYWQDLAPTVDLVLAFLLEAWAELCNCNDDDAMVEWFALTEESFQRRSLRYITTATDLVQEYICICTCGHTRAGVPAA
jgi:hypothetical protein